MTVTLETSRWIVAKPPTAGFGMPRHNRRGKPRNWPERSVRDRGAELIVRSRAAAGASDAGGKLSGSIETVFDQSKKDAVCDKCSDERKDKRVVGLQILRNVVKDAED